MTLHSPDDLAVDVSVGDDLALVQLRGEIDAHTAPCVEETFAELTEAGARHIVADLEEVSFIDSRGLNVLARSLVRLRSEEGQLTLRSPNARVAKVLEISGLADFFPIDRTGPGGTI